MGFYLKKHKLTSIFYQKMNNFKIFLNFSLKTNFCRQFIEITFITIRRLSYLIITKLPFKKKIKKGVRF